VSTILFLRHCWIEDRELAANLDGPVANRHIHIIHNQSNIHDCKCHWIPARFRGRTWILLSFYYATMPPTKISKEGVPIKITTTTKVALALSVAWLHQLDQLTWDAQHPKGSTWTKMYGNLSLSCVQSSSRAAEQRSQNTHLVGTASARASALCPPFLESNGEATVVAPVLAPVLAHCRQEKRPILDIFAFSVHLKSPKRMKSGVDMIWDCKFGANSLDLSLHKPHSELNAKEKKSWKTAKNTRAKMEATELAGLCSNRVKEILACKQVPFSQASDYQSGRVADELGDNFCSQDALKMIRNQLDDNSSDDK